MADFLEQAEGFLGQLDLSFLERHRQELLDALQNSMELVTACARAALDLVTSLPTVVTLVIVTVCAAFFFTRDMKGSCPGDAVSSQTERRAMSVRR